MPSAQFPGWPRVSLLLTAPVATQGAWPLYRASFLPGGHGPRSAEHPVIQAFYPFLPAACGLRETWRIGWLQVRIARIFQEAGRPE
jgi:hypothetical protein